MSALRCVPRDDTDAKGAFGVHAVLAGIAGCVPWGSLRAVHDFALLAPVDIAAVNKTLEQSELTAC